MDQEGTLSIVQRGLTYQVRYASDNPYEHDRQPYTCPDEAHLASWLHHLSLEPWTIQQTFAELQRGRGVTVLRMTCSALEVARLFPPSEGRAVGRDSRSRL